MVDINLLDEEKTGEEERIITDEEERVDEFTQTSSMDTQELSQDADLEQTDELAFDERTETFDATKAGISRGGGYSSIVSKLIILGSVLLLGAAIYFFMIKGGGDEPDNIAETSSGSEEIVSPGIEDTDPGTSSETESGTETGEIISSSGDTPDMPAEGTTETSGSGTPTSKVPEGVSTGVAGFSANSKAAIGSVTSLINSVPANLNTTLLSYAGETVRLEYVASNTAEANDFTGQLRQFFGPSNFKIISENQVAVRGRSLDKVLVLGKHSSTSGNSASVNFLNSGQAENLFRRLARESGVTIRELRKQTGSFVSGYQKIPILLRVSGAKASIVNFLEQISLQNINVEFSKILLISPDVVNYSDDNLILVLNMYLYQQS